MPEQASTAAPATAADIMRPPLTTVEQSDKVCDRMQQAGLVTVEDIATSRGTLCCVLTDSGTRLARWVKDRQRMALSKVVYSMRPDVRDALIHGLRELAAMAPGTS